MLKEEHITLYLCSHKTIQKVMQGQRAPGQHERAGLEEPAREGVNVKSKNKAAHSLLVYSLYRQVVLCFTCFQCKYVHICI